MLNNVASAVSQEFRFIKILTPRSFRRLSGLAQSRLDVYRIHRRDLGVTVKSACMP